MCIACWRTVLFRVHTYLMGLTNLTEMVRIFKDDEEVLAYTDTFNGEITLVYSLGGQMVKKVVPSPSSKLSTSSSQYEIVDFLKEVDRCLATLDQIQV